MRVTSLISNVQYNQTRFIWDIKNCLNDIKDSSGEDDNSYLIILLGNKFYVLIIIYIMKLNVVLKI